ncbi:MAG: hypothetical protein CM1200mP35_01140 [Chloroflexota bacterium]|nr:MAG: hypothetical protein CM1200mP35_01140 [Chloroflexota bacterium]
MSINGHVIDHGTGGDVLGHPFKALAWLANHMIEREKPYYEHDNNDRQHSQNQVFEKGDQVKYDFDGLGLYIYRSISKMEFIPNTIRIRK